MKNFNRSSIVGVAVLVVSVVLGLMGPITAFAFASPATVDLGAAGNFAILAKSGISTTAGTLITGDIGVSPIDSTAITGPWVLNLPTGSAFSTSPLVTGKVYAVDYADPTPANLTTAVSNLETAITSANGRAVDNTQLTGIAAAQCVTGTCDLAGLTLAPGVYTFTGPGNVIITDNVILSGEANDVWIFIIPGTLNISSAKQVILGGNAKASNIFWSVADVTTLGTNSTFEGNILEAGSVIAIQTGATLNGRALSKAAVTLDANTVTVPTVSVSTPCVGAVTSSTLVDATQAVSNDPDSGNVSTWATDTFTKHIQV